VVARLANRVGYELVRAEAEKGSRAKKPDSIDLAGAPIAQPVTTEQAINIVTEQIGLFESVLRRYGAKGNAR
jgi:hypothetical protein